MLFDYCFILCPYFSLRDVSQFALKHLTAYLRHQVYEQVTVEMAHLVLHHTRVELVELLDLPFQILVIILHLYGLRTGHVVVYVRYAEAPFLVIAFLV